MRVKYLKNGIAVWKRKRKGLKYLAYNYYKATHWKSCRRLVNKSRITKAKYELLVKRYS